MAGSTGADGYRPITTHVFDPDDPYLSSDAVFGVKESLIVDFRKIDDPAEIKRNGFNGPYWETVCDFVLAKG